jgi:hypothetical protein
MPYGLRLLTRLFITFAILFPIFALVFLLAYALGNHSINGVQVSYSEFWQRMNLLTLFGSGVYSAILSYGFLHASPWSRPLCLLPVVVSSILAVIHRYSALTIYNYLNFICFMAILTLYLYFRQTVRDYYAKTDNPVV